MREQERKESEMNSVRTETTAGGTVRLAGPLSSPVDTYRAAQALARTVFPREPATDAVRRLHHLSHTEALLLAESTYGAEAVDYSFYSGQERALGLAEE